MRKLKQDKTAAEKLDCWTATKSLASVSQREDFMEEIYSIHDHRR